MMRICKECGAKISDNAAGLNFKLINRCTEEFMCIECLAKYFDTDTERLKSLIDAYKKAGCYMFT